MAIELKKKCNSCHAEKVLPCFRTRVNRNKTSKVYYRSICIECEALDNKKRKIKNKGIIAVQRKAYYAENKEKENNNSKSYYKTNKPQIIQRAVRNWKKRYHNDPVFRIKHLISGAARDMLKSNFHSKCNLSILKFLSYSIQELKEHFEKQFEPWMNWENHGKYDTSSWDDNDSSTWTWNIDHIIPHSTFKYISMEDQSFKDCWALSNLRPLSSKQNLLKGHKYVT